MSALCGDASVSWGAIHSAVGFRVANREVNREFRRIRLLGAILKADMRADDPALTGGGSVGYNQLLREEP
jgi:hypothetical protein